MNLNVLKPDGIVCASFFDGMSCGQIALKSKGIKVKTYYASEIDKHAVAQSLSMFPNMVHLGDITAWRSWGIDWSTIDLVLAGSPCQGFSRAGKGLNFEDPRSKLFFIFMEIYNYILSLNPNVKFLFENVDMDRWCLGVISRYLGVFPVNINSHLVSAQNRNRWYWSNIKTRTEGLYAEVHTDIPQPQDRGIYLKDILEPEEDIPEKYYIKNIKANFDAMDINLKGKTLRSGGSKTQSNKHNYDLIKINKKGEPSPNQEKASCFTAGGNSGGNHSDMDLIAICVSMKGRNIVDGKRQDYKSAPFVQRLEPRYDDKTNCLSTVEKDNLVFVYQNKQGNNGLIFTENYVQYDISGKGHRSQTDRAYYYEGKHGCLLAGRTETKTGVFLTQKPRGFNKGGDFTDKSPTLTSNSWEHNHTLNIDYRIRRLTVLEASRLQTIPEWYKFTCSDSQAYKMLGNGWTVEVIAHILSFWEI